MNGHDEWLRSFPKAELHVHLDGSVKPETLRELAERQGASLPEGDLRGRMTVDPDCGSLTEYLSKFSFVLPFLQTAEALERVAYETAEQAADDGCLYVEVRFAPLLHTERGLTAEEAVKHTVNGLRRAERELGITARAIVIAMRHEGFERNREAIEAAARYLGDGVCAVDLAGDEAGYPPELHQRLFDLASERKLPVTIHAGEAGGAANVRYAVERLGAVRIGHGVRIKEDPEVIELVRSRRIPLEMCPLSNIQTKAADGWERYPIRDYMDRGLIVTVNTDNRTVSGTTMTNEYKLLAEKLGFGFDELAAVSLNGIDAAFADEPLKAELRIRMKRKLAEIGVALKE
ncbi:adenosine deaminase [Paenibacillus thailandensis]|uniref:adenosine deaminase n=1 Tax=Paenibacillus thailandensis TaxID=393250 RepID=A0ABW5R122_9BACL